MAHPGINMEINLKVEYLVKKFRTSASEITVLNDINFEVREGEGISIVGPSGSGKTTLLGLCAGLDQPTSGSITLMDNHLDKLNEDDRAYLRNQYVGFVFQNFQLLPTLSALENVLIPLEMRGVRNSRKSAQDLLDRVGLANRFSHYPAQLSGGEQQRVAIARAFITSPKIVFVDEPTGNLDEETAGTITDLLFAMNREQGTTLVMVTHNYTLAEHTGRILTIKGGRIEKDMKI